MGGGSGSGGVRNLSAAAAQTMMDANLVAHADNANGSDIAGGRNGRPPHPLGHCVSYDDRKFRQAAQQSDDEQTAATSDMTGSTEPATAAGRHGVSDRSMTPKSSSKRRLGVPTGAMRRNNKSSSSADSPHHVPKGLKNVGNTCYANAALQCLLSTALSHALLDPTQAVLFRRYSSNQNILAQGSGSVDSGDDDYEFDAEIGMSIDAGQSPPPSPSEEEKAKKKEQRMLKREARRKEREKIALRETCRWLTGELTDITKEYTTFLDLPTNTKQAEPQPSPSGLLGLLSIGGHSPTSSREKGKVVDPGEITRNVHKLSQTLRPYQQEDAHEFLRALLSTLTMEGQNRQLSALFDGLLESSVTCRTCDYSSLTRDRYMDLSLDIADSSIKTLTDALRHFTKTETLDANNMVLCRGCRERRIVTKGLRLATAPTILVCHLKRFAWNVYGQQTRLNKDVTFPLQLDIDDCMSEANRSTPPPYELVGVLVHAGRSCDSGHYYSFVRSNDRWYKCNDSNVTEVGLDIVLRQKAYMLIYEVEGMRQNHNCESYGKYHPAPKPAPPTTASPSNSHPKSKSPSSLKNKKNRRKGHFRSQSAPRPVREPSPFRQERSPFASSPPDNDVRGDDHASEANGSTIASAFTSVLSACAAAGDSICGLSVGGDKSYIPHEVSLDPEADSQCSDDEGVAMDCIPTTAASCCTEKSHKPASKPPLSPPRPSPKTRDASESQGEPANHLPNLTLNLPDHETAQASKASSPKEAGSSTSRRSKAGKESPSTKRHRRKKQYHRSNHNDDSSERSVSDSEERGGHKLKGLDILKKKGRAKSAGEKPSRPIHY
mmetsp:Transcript_35078/g.76786  ORF Transcript_35078/g.76786 Transcript_35078/m.76786 type:complete len:831 (-) Transcript_35078:142-2634(-)